MSKLHKKFFNYKTLIHIFFIFTTIISVLPFILIISISFSNETDIVNYGFRFIPKEITTVAYKFVFGNGSKVVKAYLVTAFYAVLGSALSVVLMAMIAYPLSRDGFKFKKPLTIFLTVTMFLSGGLIPSYVINTQVFHLGNKLMMYLLYGLISAYTVFVFRTFFKSIPESLTEAACIDGASEAKILYKIIIPLSVPVLMTFGFANLVSRWNDYTVSMYYMQDENLYTLQFLLQNLLNEVEYLRQMKYAMPQLVNVATPSETLKFAMCVVAAGPMVIIFPFFQKYFSKGMMLGAVKG